MASGRRVLPTACCVSILCACAEPSRPPPVASLHDDSQATSDATSDGDEPDLGDAESTGDADICQRVDLLFVIDNSASMADEQASLVASFPGFIAGIAEVLGPETDYHVGVVTTDENSFNRVGCRRIGALTTQTGGESSSNAVCGPFASGGGFMTVADPLPDAFACTAKVGTEGSGIERPMDALMSMLESDADAVGLCNDGFLRDDALLVLTIITDEDDDGGGGSRGNPSDWYDAVVAAKADDPTRVVALSLLGRPAPNACVSDLAEPPEVAERIARFTELFDHGDVADICAADYGTFFATAVGGIAEACDIVIPLE